MSHFTKSLVCALGFLSAAALADDGLEGKIRVDGLYPVGGFPTEAQLLASPAGTYGGSERVPPRGNLVTKIYLTPADFNCFKASMAVIDTIAQDSTTEDDWYPQYNGYSTRDMFWTVLHIRGPVNVIQIWPNLTRGSVAGLRLNPGADESELDPAMHELRIYLTKYPQMRNDPRVIARWNGLWNAKRTYVDRKAGVGYMGFNLAYASGVGGRCYLPTLAEIRFAIEDDLNNHHLAMQHEGDWTYPHGALSSGAAVVPSTNPNTLSNLRDGIKEYP